MNKKTKIFLLEFIVLLVIGSTCNDILLGFIWIVLHEMAHVLVAKKFNVSMYNISLHMAGVSVDIKNLDDLEDHDRLKVFLAGPIFNMGAIIIMLLVKKYYNIEFVRNSIYVNLVLFIFNMLPAYPLDGVNIYEILLNRKILYKKVKAILINISFGVSVVLGLLFLGTVYIHKVNFSLLISAILITYSTFLEKKKTIYILMGNIFKKRMRLINSGYIENKSISVYYKKDLLKTLSLVDRNKFNSFFILDEELKLLGVIYEDELIDALKNYGNMTLEEFLKKEIKYKSN